MVTFGSGANYSHPMDRDYGHSSPVDNSTNDVGVGIKDLGMSIGLGPVPNVQAVAAKMRSGVKKMELGFIGAGKGGPQAHTPGMYGSKQRQALREMQEANKFDFTTHAGVNIIGLAGMDQQGNFSRQNKERSINEIKRAIDFASDVTRGGPVVVHSGEFFRHITDSDWNKEGQYKDKFQLYEGEEDRASYRVVDTRTGGVIQEARKNRKVSRPVWNTAMAGEEYTDLNGNKRIARTGEKVYLDYFGKQLNPEQRVPKFNPKTNEFEVQQMGWNELQEEAGEMTERAKKEWRNWKQGKMTPEEMKNSKWTRFLKPEIISADQIKIKPEEAYIIATLETNAAQSRGWALAYGGDFDEMVDNLKRLREARKYYEEIEKTTDPEEKWKLKQQVQGLAMGLVPRDAQYPLQIIDREIKQLDQQMKRSQEAAAGSYTQAKEAEETIRHVESADSYALNESYDSYAQAAIQAMMRSNDLEKKGQLKKPLVVAVENLFPESFGSHPDELIELITNSRKKMVEELTRKGMSEEKARKESEEHLYATFDTAHCNMWWKYWKGDEDKTMAENKEEFNKWMLSKVEEMAKKKIIGHLHLVDNYGYEDEHLAPGEGNTPISDVIKVLKKHGYKGDMIVEPGADYNLDVSGTHTLMKAWRSFGSPIYGTAFGKRTWEDVGYGYFGQNKPPYFTFGGYSPSEDWTLWSGVPLE